MLTAKGPPRIQGVTLGEATINLITRGAPPIVGTFALVRDDGEYAGRVDKRLEWSENTMRALAALQECMEQDMLDALFTSPPPSESSTTEPEQM